jgi:hypothetical protein
MKLVGALSWQEVRQMKHGTNGVVRWHAWRRRGALPLRAVFSALVLVAGLVTGAAVTALVAAPAAHASTNAPASTVPAAPAGWNTVFSDDFAGPAGSPPSSANWFYDIGTGYGTGEIETTTNSTSNVSLATGIWISPRRTMTGPGRPGGSRARETTSRRRLAAKWR